MEQEKFDDIEMGSEKPENQPEEQPKVNHYAQQNTNPEPKVETAHVDPSAPAPEPKPQPAPQQPEQQPSQSQIPHAPLNAAQTPASTGKPPKKPRKPVDPAARKRAIIIALGTFGGIMMLFLIFSFLFITQSSADTINPIAQLLGIRQSTFVNGLITFIHLIFILISLVTFVFTMLGLFKASMAKKDDKITKKRGIKQSIVAGIVLIGILIIWLFVYVYLDGKRIRDESELLPPIVTQPEETLNLTAPVDIRFDASNIPIDNRKYQIISYRWDFGDGEVGTNQIVTHRYEDKGDDGRYDVILTVTKREKQTGEETEDQFSKTITVANQAITASFTASPQSGEAPLEVKFDASDSSDPDGRIVRYEWDFDEDGEFDDAEGEEAEFTFEKNGKYEVALRVTSDNDEFDIVTKQIDVKEDETPEAVITISGEPERFEVGQDYIFRAEDSTSPNGDITEYEWDFGDGSRTERTKTAKHSFDKAGEYEIVLTVVDEEDEEGEARLTINVQNAAGSPVAKFTTTPAATDGRLSGQLPLKVEFDASSSTDPDDEIVDYEWDFDGDGRNDGFGARATHLFTDEGIYQVKLTVTDAAGNESTTGITVDVEAQGIAASLEANKVQGNVPLTVTFDASSSSYQDGEITSYKWDFGDGSRSKLGSAKITHKYKEIGTYTATVTVIGSDNSQDTAEMLITVREIPLQACFTSVIEEGPAPLETVFDPGCTTGTVANYFWDFGDGNTSSSVKPSHTFGQPGEYTVILEVSDSDNTVSFSEVTITVTAP